MPGYSSHRSGGGRRWSRAPRRPLAPGELPSEPVVHPAASAAERVLPIVCDVIGQADRDKPADGVLRDTLRAQRSLTPRLAREVSHAVFAYYRWLGWLDPQATRPEQVRVAREMQTRFDESPSSIPSEELLARAIPAWVQPLVAVTPEWLRSLQAPPRLWLRVRPGQEDAVPASLGDCRPLDPERWPETFEYEGSEDLFRRPEFHAGAFEIQDIASQCVGRVCAPNPGETWWDACAGEGGKTMHLSALMQNKGMLWASDRSVRRLERLKVRAARAQVFNYRSAPWDGTSRLPTRTRFDGVLVDAPCSNLGTWQRNPHARWTTTLDDVRELAEVQHRLLTHAAAALKPGGRLIYAVCTLTRAETDEVVNRLSAEQPRLALQQISSPWDLSAPPSDRVWLWPQDTGGNGMFIAEWRCLPATPS